MNNINKKPTAKNKREFVTDSWSYPKKKEEWSELYVLIALLAEGKLYQSDFELKKDSNNVYDIIKAYKSESDYNLEFDRNEKIVLSKIEKDKIEHIGSFSIADLEKVSKILYKGIKDGKGKSFAIINVDDFIQAAQIQKLKANANVKADIRLKFNDHRFNNETNLGFSIKSLLGGDSTLFKTGAGNNFIYSVENKLSETILEFNKRTYKPSGGLSKLTYRLQELVKIGATLTFKNIQSPQLWKNLKMVDGDLPDILAWALYYRWIYREPGFSEISAILEKKDPLNFYDNQPSEQKLYEYKLKRFLTEAAMGMTSETPWLGEYDSFGGVIIAKNDGDIVCFHIYDFNLFRNYLIKNTKFEQPSTGEDNSIPGTPRQTGKNYHYGWLFENKNELYFKINLQVRFK
ncbi:MAG: HpaII family restriction endonuclease [Bacteroidales bacterium]|nr:HpaII family restriction endonuclease [Bacteroidales bacterium]